jgi:cytochrome c oxidase subunit I
VATLRQAPAAGVTPRAQRKGQILAGWLSSTDHKVIGHMYLITSFFFFLCAGVMAMLIAIPTGIKFFNWTGTMWKGQLTFEPPMLFTIGFLVTFLFGGITGVMLASPPLDFAVTDSYFVVAHFHYVLAGTVLFAMFAGFYFWWPKMTGTMLNSRVGKLQFWLMFIGYHMTFLVQHWIGVEGMPRRTANYPLLPGNVTTLNIISSVGSWILALSILVFLWNVYASWRHGARVTEEDPWGFCSSLEWATSCPPPRHNFYRITGFAPSGPRSNCTTRRSRPARRPRASSRPFPRSAMRSATAGPGRNDAVTAPAPA